MGENWACDVPNNWSAGVKEAQDRKIGEGKEWQASRLSKERITIFMTGIIGKLSLLVAHNNKHKSKHSHFSDYRATL